MIKKITPTTEQQTAIDFVLSNLQPADED